jgi:hypothetical protein
MLLQRQRLMQLMEMMEVKEMQEVMDMQEQLLLAVLQRARGRFTGKCV